MKKKCLTLAVLLFLLMGCNNNAHSGNNNDTDVGNHFVKENTTIEFLCLTDDGYRDELERMIKEFKEIEPKVTVNLVNPIAAGNYSVLEKTVISGFFKDDYPDLAQCYPDNVVQYLDRGYAVNLEPYLNHEEYGLKDERNDYITGFLDEGTHYSKEGTYSLPFCKSTELMYYNASVLLGLNLSGIDATINNGEPLDEDYFNNLTWEEMFDKLCPALTTYDRTHNIFVDNDNSGIVTYDSDQNFFITLANQYSYGYTKLENGKGKIEFNNDGMKNLMLKMNDMRSKGYLQTRGSYGRYVSELFTGKQSLFTIASTAGLSYNYDKEKPFKIGVAKLPKAEGRDYSSINQGGALCVLDHHDDNRSLAAYLFWKYITNEKNSSLWAIKSGYMGIRNSAYQSEEYIAALAKKDSEDLYEQAVADNLKMTKEVSDTTFDTALFKGSSNARTAVGLLITDCLKSNDLASEIDNLFKTYADDAEKYLD